jgi:8-oxo-dGTP pyrophosphatase MutT (NUDIX family)
MPESLSPSTAEDAVAALVAMGPDAWDRSRTLHLTASAYIVHPPTRRVLLLWHPKHGAWAQVGGHAEAGESDPLVVALREAREESGLTDLRVHTPEPICLALFDPWEGGRKVQHLDIAYCLATDTPDEVVGESMAAPVRWYSLAGAYAASHEAPVHRALDAIAAIFERQ